MTEAEDLKAEEREQDGEREKAQEDGEWRVVQQPAGHEGGREEVWLRVSLLW